MYMICHMSMNLLQPFVQLLIQRLGNVRNLIAESDKFAFKSIGFATDARVSSPQANW